MKLTDKVLLTEMLKLKWMSNYAMQKFLQSSGGDVIGRTIRKEARLGLIKGYEWVERPAPEDMPHRKEFKLERIEDASS